MSKQIVDGIRGDFLSYAFADTNIDEMTFEKCGELVRTLLNKTYPSPYFTDYERGKIYVDIDFMIQKLYSCMTEDVIKQYIEINSINIVNAMNDKLVKDICSFYEDKLFDDKLHMLTFIPKHCVRELITSKEKIKIFYDMDCYQNTLKCAKLTVYTLLVRGIGKKYMFKNLKFRI